MTSDDDFDLDEEDGSQESHSQSGESYTSHSDNEVENNSQSSHHSGEEEDFSPLGPADIGEDRAHLTSKERAAADKDCENIYDSPEIHPSPDGKSIRFSIIFDSRD